MYPVIPDHYERANICTFGSSPTEISGPCVKETIIFYYTLFISTVTFVHVMCTLVLLTHEQLIPERYGHLQYCFASGQYSGGQ